MKLDEYDTEIRDEDEISLVGLIKCNNQHLHDLDRCNTIANFI